MILSFLCFRTENDAEADCLECPVGMYCESTGATEPTGPCKAGHICFGRAILDDPIYNDDPGPDENNKTKTIVTFGDACHPGKLEFLVLCVLVSGTRR